MSSEEEVEHLRYLTLPSRETVSDEEETFSGKERDRVEEMTLILSEADQ